MAQLHDRGYVRRSLRRIAEALSLLGLIGALATASFAHTQAASPASNSKDKPSTFAVNQSTPAPVVPEPVAPAEPLPASPEPLRADQTPSQPPTVTWDGALLNIDAENSTLSDILKAVGAQTGALMEFPPSAFHERVFVHVGPGSVRDVISSLLYGTGFDYIIEASEDEPDTLRRVVLTASGQENDPGSSFADSSGSDPASSGGTVRGSIAQGVPARDGMRMMRGWAGPGKPAFQAEAESALAAEQAAKDSGEAPGTADANTPNPTATESTSAGQEASGSDSHSSAAAASPANANSVTEPDAPPATASASPSSSSDSNDQTGALIQSMTRMFEQRRQIQAHQNQPAQEQQSPPN